jgi:nitrate/TMAO reductase-like tetraheme cytochrome c subunit
MSRAPNCIGCHDKEGKEYATSIHGMSHAMGASGAAECWDCHGSHEILPVKDGIACL